MQLRAEAGTASILAGCLACVVLGTVLLSSQPPRGGSDELLLRTRHVPAAAVAARGAGGTRGRVATFSAAGVAPEAHAAHKAVSAMIDRLSSRHSERSQGLLKEAQDTLAEVQRLEGSGGAAPAAAAGSPAGSKLAGGAGIADDVEISKDLPLRDDEAVRSELRKLRSTARHLRREMRGVGGHGYSKSVSRESARVARDGSSLQRAHDDESDARRSVVSHELKVQRQRLAQAEEDEEAAARAAASADRAEALAAEKHREAALDERDAAQGRMAARRAREIAAVGAGDATGLARFAKKHGLAGGGGTRPAWMEKECSGAIALLGCARLPTASSCARFCPAAAGAGNPGAKRAPAGGGGKGGGAYVDDVYGKPYDPSTYLHERKGFFTREPEARDSDQRAAYGKALAGLAYSRGGDVSSDGRDFRQVARDSSMVSAGAGAGRVLARERAVEDRLSRALEREQGENARLRERLAGSDEEVAASRDTSHPPLPRYAAEGTQALSQVPWSSKGARGVVASAAVRGGGAEGEANKEEEEVHPRAAMTTDGSLFDPFRP